MLVFRAITVFRANNLNTQIYVGQIFHWNDNASGVRCFHPLDALLTTRRRLNLLNSDLYFETKNLIWCNIGFLCDTMYMYENVDISDDTSS